MFAINTKGPTEVPPLDGGTTLDARIGRAICSAAYFFVFVGRRRQLVKIIFADATGACVFAKRLDAGLFSLPASPASDPSRH